MSGAGDRKEIVFEDASATINEGIAGGYTIDLGLSKEGYADAQLAGDFAIIDQTSIIASASRCNGNGRCDSPEDKQSCPQDCTKKGIGGTFIVGALLVVLMAILSFTILYLFKKKKAKAVKSDPPAGNL